MNMNKLRQTGRSTRMLLKAKSLAEDGVVVYVIADRESHRRQLEEQYDELGGRRDEFIKFLTPQLGNFDWDGLRLIGSNPNCVVLVDHYAIERRFHNIIEMLHAFDEDADDVSQKIRNLWEEGYMTSVIAEKLHITGEFVLKSLAGSSKL